MKILHLACLSLALAVPAIAQATADDLLSVAAMQNRHRVLVIFTPSLLDARLASQRAIMARLALEAAKRDLLFVQVDPMNVVGAADKGDRLRRKFRVPVTAYHAILIDKDGRVLREAPGPIDGAAMLGAIDRAPVRQAELRRARSGKPAPAHH